MQIWSTVCVCVLRQVLNLVPWGGVALALPPVSLADAEGWPAVGRGIAAVYINDITTHQVQFRLGTLIISADQCLEGWRILGRGVATVHINDITTHQVEFALKVFITRAGQNFEATAYINDITTYQVGVDPQVAMTCAEHENNCCTVYKVGQSRM